MISEKASVIERTTPALRIKRQIYLQNGKTDIAVRIQRVACMCPVSDAGQTLNRVWICARRELRLTQNVKQIFPCPYIVSGISEKGSGCKKALLFLIHCLHYNKNYNKYEADKNFIITIKTKQTDIYQKP